MPPVDKSECLRMFALLSEYLDDDLPADLRDRIALHVADCPPCVQFLHSLQQSINLCRGFDPDTVPSALTDETEQQLRAAYAHLLQVRQSSSEQ